MVRPKSRCTIAKHHISGRTTGLKLCPHEVHVGSNVGKVLAITGTEIVEVGLAIGIDGKAVARTLAMAGKQIAALTALAGQACGLLTAELLLPLAIEQLGERLLTDVA